MRRDVWPCERKTIHLSSSFWSPEKSSELFLGPLSKLHEKLISINIHTKLFESLYILRVRSQPDKHSPDVVGGGN